MWVSPDRKILDSEEAAKEIASALQSFLRKNDVKITEVVEKMGGSYAHWNRILNWKTTTNNEEVYERLALAMGMPLSDFRDVVKSAKMKALGADVQANGNTDAAFRAKHGISDDDKWRLVQGFIDMINKSEK